ncbi:MAG TPA: GNAT family N-acetyltransferase [Candidatus Sumerlaeota bacterium]|nr:MAG: Acetyltransferase YpeA [candidate division BRC1 bacterium ADurb.BinA292]HOE97808.1 GNAT family N-acetyltransferase [Candidatus Sumerlaeota bacterium]HOR27409.1 GNAT family N-acetyltransferase [Candidatus Sumerlaeota bacterium]HPK03309.1 GNAT family N-acetyltransferase [Candidatus Sumerlaeota bacterium]
MPVTFLEFTPQDYDEALNFWRATPGIGLSETDSRENIEAFIQRNPGLSFLARDAGRLVGTVLGGHDGRRGYLYQLAVLPAYRGKGVGTELVERCITRLGEIGIQKCHIMIYATNIQGQTFWESIGWHRRTEILVMSRLTSAAPSDDV